jgi:hypothetical protein
MEAAGIEVGAVLQWTPDAQQSTDVGITSQPGKAAERRALRQLVTKPPDPVYRTPRIKIVSGGGIETNRARH